VSVTVEKVGRSKLFWFAVGVLAGGTVLAYPVAALVAWIKAKVLRQQ
jgi:hypothetical protein